MDAAEEGPIGYPPFARWARLNQMIESLRAQNWDVTGSLGTLAVTSEPTLKQVVLEGPDVLVEDDDGADH